MACAREWILKIEVHVVYSQWFIVPISIQPRGIKL